jgi:hypothetical protein
MFPLNVGSYFSHTEYNFRRQNSSCRYSSADITCRYLFNQVFPVVDWNLNTFIRAVENLRFSRQQL